MNLPFPYDPHQSHAEVTQSILRYLAKLPHDEQPDALLSILACIMPSMSEERILAIRDEITRDLNNQLDLPIVRDTIELIDGHLAMREIAGLDEDGPDPEIT